MKLTIIKAGRLRHKLPENNKSAVRASVFLTVGHWVFINLGSLKHARLHAQVAAASRKELLKTQLATPNPPNKCSF